MISVLSPVDVTDKGALGHPLFALMGINQPGIATTPAVEVPLKVMFGPAGSQLFCHQWMLLTRVQLVTLCLP